MYRLMLFNDFSFLMMTSLKRVSQPNWGLILLAWMVQIRLYRLMIAPNDSGDQFFLASVDAPNLGASTVLEIQIIPWKWFGTTTNSSKTTNGKCCGISIQNFCANFPISFNSIFAVTPNLGVSTIFPKKCWRSLVHMVTKQEPLLV